jgi:hypothetical protein
MKYNQLSAAIYLNPYADLGTTENRKLGDKGNPKPTEAAENTLDPLRPYPFQEVTKPFVVKPRATWPRHGSTKYSHIESIRCETTCAPREVPCLVVAEAESVIDDGLRSNKYMYFMPTIRR